MKAPFFAAVVLVLSTLPASAASSFPGLKAILSDAEWKRAGLDQLTPDQIGVIDAALIRREAGIAAQHQAEVASARQAAVASTPPKTSSSVWARFGLPMTAPDWRDFPPLKAKVVKWEAANRFVLDNGQAWESNEPIVYDLVGKEIEIQARPNGRFALVVGDVNTTIRVMRIR